MWIRWALRHGKDVGLLNVHTINKHCTFLLVDNEKWCKDYEDYFKENCPILDGDVNGCCLCTKYHYYHCGKSCFYSCFIFLYNG